jgi:hypothetical protein
MHPCRLVTLLRQIARDREAAPASSGMRMRQRGSQSETRALTLGSILSAGQTRSQARSAANSRTRPRSVSSVQRKRGDFRFSMAPPRSPRNLSMPRVAWALGPRCHSNHRASKNFCRALGDGVLARRSCNPPHHHISRPVLGQRTEDR